MTFPEMTSPLRTNIQFSENQDGDHHVDTSQLTGITDMVTNCPIDYMHLVCLGVIRRLLNLWMIGPLPSRLKSSTIDEISSALIGLQGFIPKEFARKPRSLRDVDRWKATEFRQFYRSPDQWHCVVNCRNLCTIISCWSMLEYSLWSIVRCAHNIATSLTSC